MVELKLVLPGQKEYIEYIDKVLLETLKIWGVKAFEKIHFAIHELVINAVQAYEKCGKKSEVVIALFCDHNNLKGYVKDYCGGVKEQITNKQTNALDESGRGYLYINYFMDDIDFEYKEKDVFMVKFTKTDCIERSLYEKC